MNGISNTGGNRVLLVARRPEGGLEAVHLGQMLLKLLWSECCAALTRPVMGAEHSRRGEDLTHNSVENVEWHRRVRTEGGHHAIAQGAKLSE